MWAYLCWLQKSWVCHLILKTMPSCPGLTLMLHFIISLTARSVAHSPLHQWKVSRGGHLHFKEKTFSKPANTFNNRMWYLFLNWCHLTTLKWTGATHCTLTKDITWLLILIIQCIQPQWGTITHQSGWLLSKSLQAINAGEGVEKREPSYTVGGSAN